jgi:hypothetical protein
MFAMRAFALATLACNPPAYFAMREMAYWRHSLAPGSSHWAAFRFVYPI